MEESFKRAGGLIETDSRPEHCEIHGDFISEGFRIGRNMHWRMCPACREIERVQAEEEQARQKAAREQEQLEKAIGRAGIPHRFREKSLDNFIADTPQKEKALAVAREFADNFDAHFEKGTILVFSGLPGTGKSHLANAILMNVVRQGRSVLYTSAIDAIRMIRDTWRKGSEESESAVLDRLAGVKLLVLDEIGVQYGTDSEQVNLFDIINKRYQDMMPTILLTNQNKAGMKEFLGDRSFDRLREGGIWVTFDWQTHRGAR